jgi:hypothetical protein
MPVWRQRCPPLPRRTRTRRGGACGGGAARGCANGSAASGAYAVSNGFTGPFMFCAPLILHMKKPRSSCSDDHGFSCVFGCGAPPRAKRHVFRVLVMSPDGVPPPGGRIVPCQIVPENMGSLSRRREGCIVAVLSSGGKNLLDACHRVEN